MKEFIEQYNALFAAYPYYFSFYIVEAMAMGAMLAYVVRTVLIPEIKTIIHRIFKAKEA